MHNKKLMSYILALLMLLNILGSVPVAYAASGNGLSSTMNALTSPTMPNQSGTDGNISGTSFFEQVFSLLFDKILGPILNIIGGGKSAANPVDPLIKVTPLPSKGNYGQVVDNGVLRGKVIVVDPGHGGSNPGAMAYGTRESDNNLAVSLKLRDKLAKAGAVVIMTRETDRTVAAEGGTLGQELAARVDIAESNHADMFVSVHSNYNTDPTIAGAMTFYPSGRSSELARSIQSALIQETATVDKGVSPATYYVLRNTSMPSILVEMGFVTNKAESARLQDEGYRTKLAQGIYNGIVRYFNNH
ncbi:MAG TPA: N-acetylmuramoyl-L-alanine amidase [Methylomusa anaerophila]|uniref:N-acetylmuramoyl-L-alanine amidase LytC n=1 Tax=Methylomusa anaerophila TaxID=1930071 RepID=A0A348APY1_9FIRM|nr:N-acetylmuramoyl-L-alanine amidase [Methylomusa anaerophila]BBB93129.1 N-acetylmuramoyl-L-alanine amidase LytC precursor [Methylomusa anaerophila]HML87038.1 N-acetylmuramoyl-L-alanine amidase [Methylomusa anaerophila]